MSVTFLLSVCTEGLSALLLPKRHLLTFGKITRKTQKEQTSSPPDQHNSKKSQALSKYQKIYMLAVNNSKQDA